MTAADYLPAPEAVVVQLAGPPGQPDLPPNQLPREPLASSCMQPPILAILAGCHARARQLQSG